MRIEVIAKIDVGQNNGATVHLAGISREMASRGQVRMWLQRAPLPAMLTSTPNLEVRLLPPPTPPGATMAIKARRSLVYEVLLALQMGAAFIRKPRPNAIYMLETLSLTPALVGKLFRVPVFVAIDGSPYREALERGGIWGRPSATVLRALGRACAGIFVFSERKRRRTLREYGVPPERVAVVPNGVDPDLYRPMEREEACRKLGLDPGPAYVVYAGTLRASQEIPLLLEAFGRVRVARPSAKLIALLPEVREFEAVAAKAGLAEVTMARHASHEEVPWYIAAASVCVAPLAARTAKRVNSVVPLKLLAYLACGRPAVTPDLRFLRFVQEESFGYVYRSGDAASLAGAIEKALCMTADQRVRLAAAAADYVRSGHSWHLVGDITEEFMRARIAAHRGLAAG